MAQLKAAEKQIADLKSARVLSDVGEYRRNAPRPLGRRIHRASRRWRIGRRSPCARREIRNRVQDQPAVVSVIGGPPDKPSIVVVTTQGARDRGLKRR